MRVRGWKFVMTVETVRAPPGGRTGALRPHVGSATVLVGVVGARGRGCAGEGSPRGVEPQPADKTKAAAAVKREKARRGPGW